MAVNGETDQGGGSGGGEATGPTTVTLQVKQPKQKQKERRDPSPSSRSLDLFRAAASGDAEGAMVKRVGPQEYYGTPVQLAVCGRLPPGVANVEEAITQRWGGGTYEVTARGSDGKPETAQIPLAGPPLPINMQQEQDRKAAEEKKALAGATPLPYGYGGYGGQQQQTVGPNGEWVYAAAQQTWAWVGNGPPTIPQPTAAPTSAGYGAYGAYGGAYGGGYGTAPATSYLQPDQVALKAADDRIAALEKKIESDKIEARLEALATQLKTALEGGGAAGGRSAMAEMLAAHTAQQQIALDRERIAADAKRDVDNARMASETASADRRAADDRASADRRAAEARDMMNMLVTTMTATMANRPNSIDDFVKLKGLMTDDSEAGQIVRIMGEGSKMFTNTIQQLKGGAAAANPPPQLPDNQAAAPQPTAGQQEDDDMRAILEFLLGKFQRGASPRDTGAMLVGFCQGRGIDAASTAGTIKAVSVDNLLKLLAVEESTTTDATAKKFIADCRASLAKPEGRAWFAQLCKVL